MNKNNLVMKQDCPLECDGKYCPLCQYCKTAKKPDS